MHEKLKHLRAKSLVPDEAERWAIEKYEPPWSKLSWDLSFGLLLSFVTAVQIKHYLAVT